MEKVIQDGKVAVLYSPGFGAGWYSWNKDQGPKIIFDPDMVNAVLNEEDPTPIAEEKYPSAYHGGCSSLKVEWINKDVRFQINEYDGSESIETEDETDWLTT